MTLLKKIKTQEGVKIIVNIFVVIFAIKIQKNV